MFRFHSFFPASFLAYPIYATSVNCCSGGSGSLFARAAMIQLSIASLPCLTASSYVLPCVIHPGSSGTLTTNISLLLSHRMIIE